MSDAMSATGLCFGRVKFFNPAKGFGFIKTRDGIDVFAHYSAIQMDGYKALTEGEEVEFELKEGRKGLYAENIRPVPKGTLG